MSYNQYTKCIDLNNYESPPYTEVEIVAAFSGIFLISAIWTGLSGIDACLLALASEALRFVKWWLYDRLICLGGDKCAIGVLVDAGEPKTGYLDKFDTDYTFDIALAPDTFGTTQPPPAPMLTPGTNYTGQDQWIGETTDIYNANLHPADGFGNIATDCNEACGQDPTCPGTVGSYCASRCTATLHCEIEGAGMHNLIKPLEAIIGLTAVSEVLSWFCAVPVLGWIACAIALILTIIAGALTAAALAHAFNDSTSPADVNPELGDTLTTNNCVGLGADILVVSGTWIYDSFHNGANEFHPVKFLQKVPNGFTVAADGTQTPVWQWTGAWIITVPDDVNTWCGMITDAGSVSTRTNQQKVENQWTVHPVIDGCTPPVVIL